MTVTVEASSRYKMLVAKTDYSGHYQGLPLWVHLLDTAGIMGELVDLWVSDSMTAAAGLSREQFRKMALFCAATHDIGKATSYFQSVITARMPAQRERLLDIGFVIKDHPSSYLHRGKTPHAWAGQWILQKGLSHLNVPEEIANIIGAHHGKPIENNFARGNANLLESYPVNYYGTESGKEELWRSAWDEIAENALAVSGLKSPEELKPVSSMAQVLLSGLLIIADWLSSNTDYFPLVDVDRFDRMAGDVYPHRIIEGWAKAEFPDRWSSLMYRMDEQAFKARFGFPANPIQCDMINVVNQCKNPGIFILEAPMGCGKTEAALSAVEVLAQRNNCSGVFFGLPTQATSNGIFGRLYRWAQEVSEDTVNAIRLAHGAAEYNDDYAGLAFKGRSRVDEAEGDGLEVHPWFQGNKKALLADFVIGTVDQFLMASLRRRHFMLRHVGLAGKVVIIDECHAYDAYMNQYLDQSLKWMAAYGVPVILLSATLPIERRKTLIQTYVKAYSKYYLGHRKTDYKSSHQQWEEEESYPLLTWTDGDEIHQKMIDQPLQQKEVTIKRLQTTNEALAVLKQRLSNGGCACVIVNTVKKAQELYQEIRTELEGFEAILYHAQFTMPDRAEIEKVILKRLGRKSDARTRDRMILIGTQVLEQSLDYDVDLMMTQLCPVDLLLQRIGRLHRHSRRRKPQVAEACCYLLEEGNDIFDKGTEAVYGAFLLNKTSRELPEVLRIPEDISRLVQIVYREPEEVDSSEYQEYKRKKQNQKSHAERMLLKIPFGNSIGNIMSGEDTTSEQHAESGVRESSAALEVLLMKRVSADRAGFICGDDSERVPMDRTPDAVLGRRIAKERIRLPHVFSYSIQRLSKTIDELERRNKAELCEWQKCPWLQGELVLLLNHDGKTTLMGYEITYSIEQGLICKREERPDEREGI